LTIIQGQLFQTKQCQLFLYAVLGLLLHVRSCSRLQIPLKLAWAVTIHKAQGLTLNKVVIDIDIGKKEFSSGLAYVTCSRVRSLQDLLFIAPFPYQ